MAQYGGTAAAAMALSTHAAAPRDTHTSDDEEEDTRSSGAAGSGGCGAKSVACDAVPGSSVATRKPRGRPPGSKNKPKPPIVITRDSDSAMRPVILELSAGSDVVDSLSHFARRRNIGLTVLSGTGTVANVSLRHPTSHASTLTLHGRFEILSISGTFIASSQPSKYPFTISLAGAQGQVIGGIIVGTLVAAGPVTIVATSFMNPSFHRLPAEEEEEGGAEDVKPSIMGSDHGSGGTPMSVYSVAAPNPLNCQLPPDVLHWATPSSRPHHPSPY